METNNEDAVLILSVGPDGKKTYTLQSDPTKRYSVNESGELVELNDHFQNGIKLEIPELDLGDDTTDEVNAIETDDDSLFAQLQNREGLGVMSHHLVPEFNDDSLTESMEHVDFEMESDAINGDKTGSQNDGENEDEDEEPDDVLVMHMDIRDPLSKLRTSLEQRLGVSLHDYEFWLQDTSQLESHKNLVDQCVSGEGVVQINVQIRTDYKIINIVDVLKPAEEYIDTAENYESESHHTIEDEEDENEAKCSVNNRNQVIKRWTIDNQFKKDQQRLNIPTNPYEWSEIHVKHWLQWAVRQFSLSRIKLSDWIMTGEQLCNLSLYEFQSKVPEDPNDIFWTHLELLKKCKLVAVLQTEGAETNVNYQPTKLKTKFPKTQKIVGNVPLSMVEAYGYGCGNRTGNNGQIQLWQFLLELLTDKTKRNVIQWIGNEGEFKLINPEVVAQLWGERKNKPTMNYEKLSRALRYYYDGDMISKVPGKRFVYKFVCDLKQLLGYDAAELAALIESCDKQSRKLPSY